MNPIRVVLVIVGLVLLVAGLVVLWFGMRAVMGVGGTCAEGGPFVIAQHCPDGTNAIVPAVLLGIGGLILYVKANDTLPGPDFSLLAWPALFISLGYNFLEPVLRKEPGFDQAGLALLLGGGFVLMGLVPLIYWLVKPGQARTIFWAHETTAQTQAAEAAQHNEDIAMLMLKQSQTEGELTPERMAAIQDVLKRDKPAEADAAASQPQGSPVMFVVQLASIVGGLVVGTWVSGALMG